MEFGNNRKAANSQLKQMILRVDHLALYIWREDVEEANFLCKLLS